CLCAHPLPPVAGSPYPGRVRPSRAGRGPAGLRLAGACTRAAGAATLSLEARARRGLDPGRCRGKGFMTEVGTHQMEHAIARCRVLLAAAAMIVAYIDFEAPLLARWIPFISGPFTMDPRLLLAT